MKQKPQPHPHAEVLRAIADGVPLSEFEITWAHKKVWEPIGEQLYTFMNDETSEVRRVPQYIMVNGFKLPKPLSVAPKKGDLYFIVALLNDSLYDTFIWDGVEREYNWLKRGIIYTTEEAAIAHAKAMLGIDPEK